MAIAAWAPRYTLKCRHKADAFDDSRLATAQDPVDKVGTDTLLTAVVGAYLDQPRPRGPPPFT